MDRHEKGLIMFWIIGLTLVVTLVAILYMDNECGIANYMNDNFGPFDTWTFSYLFGGEGNLTEFKCVPGLNVSGVG